MKKLLVTGASGFVGKNLCAYLKIIGYEITPLSLRDPKWEDFDFSGYQAIIHLAGKAHDTSNSSNPELYFKINRDLTIDLFNKFLKSGIKDFFYFSSVKSVADSVNGKLSEDFQPNPKTPYGISKHEAENYLLEQTLKDQRLFIIRPCMIHGPGNKGNLNLLYKVVKKGLPWPLGSYENKRSFLSVDNLSYLISKILNNPVKSGVYNFADDTAISTNDLVLLISKVLNKSPKILMIPRFLIYTLGKVGDILPIPFNSERLKKLTESYVVSNEKILKELNLENLPLNTCDGLIKTISSFEKKPNSI